jgi:hypothetical protein
MLTKDPHMKTFLAFCLQLLKDKKNEGMPKHRNFFILVFFKKNSRNKLDKTYFQDLVPLSRISLVDVTHEGVMSCALT